MTDDEVIGSWQQFRKAMGLVDASVVASLTALDTDDPLMSEALAAVAAAPDQMMCMTELAQRLGISSGSLTKLVDRLVQDGFVHRQHSSADRRIVFSVLTHRGIEHEPGNTAGYASVLRTELAAVGSKRLATLRRICAVIQQQHPKHLDASCKATNNEPEEVQKCGRNPRAARPTRTPLRSWSRYPVDKIDPV